MPNKEMCEACTAFCKKYAAGLRGLRDNTLMHLLMLTEYRLLSTDELYQVMLVCWRMAQCIGIRQGADRARTV